MPPSLKLPFVLAICSALASSASRPASAGPRDDPDAASYRAARDELVRAERARRLSAALVLSPDEEAASQRLAEVRRAEEERVRGYFPPAHSFLLDRTKRAIDESPLLEILKRMPKGGILHLHGSAGGDFRWLVSTATSRPDCYVFHGDSGPDLRGTLRFFPQPPGGGWRAIAALRDAAPDTRAFDEEIYRSITLGEEDAASPDIWEEFGGCFRRAWGLFDDEAVRDAHWSRMLDRLVDDNVQYVEFRGWPPGGEAIERAGRRDPDFTVKFIASARRGSDRDAARGVLERLLAARERDPARFAGFDLVEEEDRTHGTLFFVEEILAARREAARRGLTLPLFLHSGETSRASGGNLYDALLLGAPRIGHGLALVRHPLLMEMARERQVAIEVCPISNQVLGYVPDLRSHPAVAFMNAGIPVVLSPDDPGLTRHTFSHDFYEAVLAWELDLRDLKQLALSSLVHSAMDADEKARALASWERRWAAFVLWINGSR
jgi:adenosine deaminase CECR1